MLGQQSFVWPFVTGQDAEVGSQPAWAEAADDTSGPRNWLDPPLSKSPTPELYPPEPRGRLSEKREAVVQLLASPLPLSRLYATPHWALFSLAPALPTPPVSQILLFSGSLAFSNQIDPFS